MIWKDGELEVGTTNHYVPTPSARVAGLTVGGYPNDSTGDRLCKGAIDEIECFASRLGSFSTYAGGNTAYAEASENPPAIRLHWRRSPEYDLTRIERRLNGSTNGWTVLNSGNPTTSLQFTDSAIALGSIYDYRLLEFSSFDLLQASWGHTGSSPARMALWPAPIWILAPER